MEEFNFYVTQKDMQYHQQAWTKYQPEQVLIFHLFQEPLHTHPRKARTDLADKTGGFPLDILNNTGHI